MMLVLAVLAAASMLLLGLGAFAADAQAAVEVSTDNPTYSTSFTDSVRTFESPNWRTGTGENRMTLVGISWYSGYNIFGSKKEIVSVEWTPLDSDSGSAVTLTEVKTQAVSRTAALVLTYHGGTAIYAWPAGTVPLGQEGYLTVTFDGDFDNSQRYVTLGMVNFNGVDQANPLGTAGAKNNNTGNNNVTVDVERITGGMVFDSVALTQSGSSTPELIAADSQFERWNSALDDGAGYRACGAASTKLPGASGTSTTMSWSTARGSNFIWAIAAVPLLPAPYTITATAGSGGRITPDGDVSVANGADQAFTITPDAGYEIEDVLVDGASMGTPATYTFTQVDTDHTIVASFKKTHCTVTLSADPAEGGTVTGAGTYAHGEHVTLTAKPAQGYVFYLWTEGGEPVQGAGATYSFDITQDRHLVAEFNQKTCTIQASAGTGGTITPAGDVSVAYGADQAFIITPDAGYEIDDVKVDGASEGDIGTYTFAQVAADHTIEASFKKKTYTVILSADPAEGGTVEGAGSYAHGERVVLTAEAAEGYEFYQWIEGEDPVSDAGATYSFDIASDRHLVAKFNQKTYTITASAGSGGTITPVGDVSVTYGHDQAFTFTLAEGYEIDDVLVDGTSEGAVGTYTFSQVTEGHTISVTFKVKAEPRTLAYLVGPNGSISGDASQTVASGESGSAVTAVADAGYRFHMWSDGSRQNPRTDIDVQDDLTLKAWFTLAPGPLIAWGHKVSRQTVVPEGSDYVAVSGGGHFSMALKSDGSIVAWGNDSQRQVRDTPTDDGFVAIAAGGYHGLALRADGSIAIWGSNDFGQHNGTPTGNDFVAIDAGLGHSLALKSDGSVVAWGQNGDEGRTVVPDELAQTGAGVVAIAAGQLHSMALKADGTIVCWGSNTNTQCNVRTPNTGYVAISAGNFHSLALKDDGSTRAWGHSGDGRNQARPGNDFAVVSAGGAHNLVLKTDGTVDAWGSEGNRQTVIPAGDDFKAISAGGSHNLAIKPTTQCGISTGVTPEGAGTTTGDGSYTIGHDATVKATANPGYRFVRWTENGQVARNDDTKTEARSLTYAFQAILDRHLVAEFEPVGYTISATASPEGGGTVTGVPEGLVAPGTEVTLTATAQPGFTFDNWTEDGAVVSGAGAVYSFAADADRTLTAGFKKKTYTVTLSADPAPGGTTTGAGTYEHGEHVTLKAEAAQGYEFYRWIEGTDPVQGATATYSFDITQDRTLVAEFNLKSYTITFEADGGTPIEPMTVEYGATITPPTEPTRTGHTFTGWSPALPATMPALNLTVRAQWSTDEYTIQASAGSGGQIDPEGDVQVTYGHDRAFTITPDEGYLIDDVLIDGASMGAIDTYTFTEVEADHTIEAGFKKKTYTVTLSADPAPGGTTTGAGSYEHGEHVTLKAEAAQGYEFYRWIEGTDPVQGATATYSFDITQDRTLVAEFNLKSYTITFEADGGTPIEPMTVEYGATITPPTEPTRTGHTFTGWSPALPATMPAENLTVRAQWSADEYTITATAGTGGQITPVGDVQVTYGHDRAFTITPDAGHLIDDVKVDGASMGAIDTYTFTEVEADHTIEAGFKKKTYTVTLSADPAPGGTTTGGGSYEHGEHVTLKAEAAQGYEFYRWIEGTDPVQGATATYSFDITQDRTLVAEFNLKSYTITFEADGGTPIEPMTVEYGATITPPTEPTRTGHTFTGWSPALPATMPAEDLTVRAQWSADEYTITATAGTGGQITPVGDVQVTYGHDRAFTITPDAGHLIDDVKVDGASMGAIDTYTFTEVEADHTIEAGFKKKTYTVTLSADPAPGGTTTGGGSYEHGEHVTLKAEAAQGYEFYRWIEGTDPVQGADATYGFDITQDRTLVAKFNLKSYTITFEADGGTPIEPITVEYGATITPPTEPTRTGHTFTGWSPALPATMPAENLTVRAQWSTDEYTIQASAGSGGQIDPEGDVPVTYGHDRAFTITPDEGYLIDDVLIDGASVGAIDTYTFTHVAADHTIEAGFKKKTYTVTLSADPAPGGTTTGGGSYEHGEHVTLKAEAAQGYEFYRWIEGTDPVQGATATYSFDITQDRTLVAEFNLKSYTITFEADGGTPIEPMTVEYGATITPPTEPTRTGHTFTGWSPALPATMPALNLTVRAQWSTDEYTIQASAGSGGQIDPEGDVQVTYGADQAFTITPDAGYLIEDVRVDDTSVGALGTYTFEGVTRGHTIEVTFQKKTYTVSATADPAPGGTVTGGGSYAHGDPVTLEAEAAEGYEFYQWIEGTDPIPGAGATYQFEITQDRHLVAKFNLKSYTIQASAGPGGHITPDGDVSVDHGADQAFTITPDAGYLIEDVRVDDTSVGALGTYTFEGVTRGHTIEVTFQKKTYTVSATADPAPGGTVTGGGSYAHGDPVTLEAEAAEGYEFYQWIEGTDPIPGAGATYQFEITQDRHLVAKFNLKSYTIQASAGPGGHITPDGDVSVDHGADQAFTITPDAGYLIEDVRVDDTSVGALGTYTFEGVTRGHTIEVTFQKKTYTVSATADPAPGGTVTGGGSYAHGDPVTLEAEAAEGYEFYQWIEGTDPIPGAGATYQFEITQDRHLVAKFNLKSYTIQASAGPGGHITPDGDVSVDHGADQAFTITPDAGYLIEDVRVDDTSVGALGTYTFEGVTRGHTIEVTFQKKTYTVSATADPAPGGTVTGGGSYAHGDPVTLEAEAAEGYEFYQWIEGTDPIPGAGATYQFEITQDRHLVAKFNLKSYTIQASAGPGGHITPDGDVSVDHGADQAFTITPDAGYLIEDVRVDDTSVGALGTYTFEGVTRGHTIEVTFQKKTYTVSATADPAPGGTVTGGGSYAHGDPVTLEAEAAEGYEFYQWIEGTDPIPGAGATYQFEITQDRHLVAKFNLKSYTIQASAGPGGHITPDGDVSVDHGADQAFTITPDAGYLIEDVRVDDTSVGALGTYTFEGVTRGHTIEVTFQKKTYTVSATADPAPGGTVTGGGSYAHGDPVTLEAEAAEGYEFYQWIEGTDPIPGAGATYQFEITQDRHLVAKFNLKSYTIQASAGPGGHITPDGDVSVDHGADQAFTITPDAGYLIEDVRVDDTSVGALGTYTFEGVTRGHTIEVTFQKKTYTVSATADPAPGGTVTGGGSYAHGDPVTLEAEAAEGYEFYQWIEGTDPIPGAGATYQFEITQDRHLVAKFNLKSYTIQASAGPGGHITPDGDVSVDHGADQAFTITPDAGYLIEDVRVDDTSVGALGTYTFEGVTRGHTIEVTFQKKTYTVSATADPAPGGTVTGGGSYAHGDPVTLEAEAAEGYEFYQWIEGTDPIPGAGATYQFEITQDRHLVAKFNLKSYTIQASAGPGGHITPDGDVSVDHGADQAFTITPDAGYLIEDVRVDDTSVGALGTYTFEGVTRGHTIVVKGGERGGLKYLEPLSEITRVQAVVMIVRAKAIMGGF